MLPRSEWSVSWAAPQTDTSPTVRGNDPGGIFNKCNEYNHEPAMPIAAISNTSRHASHVLGLQDTNDRSCMSPFANDDERRAFLAQSTAAAPSMTATKRPSKRDPWVSSKSPDASLAHADAKTNSFRATYAQTSGTSLLGSMPRSPWLDSSSLSLSLDRSVTKGARLSRGLLSDDTTASRRSPDTDATAFRSAFRSAFVDPPWPPPSTSEYYRARTPPPPPSAARPPVPASLPRPDLRAAAARRTDATATRVLQDRERHLTEAVLSLKARLEEEHAQSTYLRKHVAWLHDRLRAENARRAAADAEVSLRARVRDFEHHTGMPRSPTAAATAAPSYRSDSIIMAKRYDDAPVPLLPSRPVQHEVDDPMNNDVPDVDMDLLAVEPGGAAPPVLFVHGAAPVPLGRLLPADARRTAAPPRVVHAGTRIDDQQLVEAVICRDRHQRLLAHTSGKLAEALAMQAANVEALQDEERQQATAYYDARFYHHKLVAAAVAPIAPAHGDNHDNILVQIHLEQQRQGRVLARLAEQQQRLLDAQEEQFERLDNLLLRANQQHRLALGSLFPALAMDAQFSRLGSASGV
ncbi:hypothetical protein GGF31_008992 [Allomyces arbusculus]|nr:hypothetical protein GGF31_008992 [Allomyces arbusculus]